MTGTAVQMLKTNLQAPTCMKNFSPELVRTENGQTLSQFYFDYNGKKGKLRNIFVHGCMFLNVLLEIHFVEMELKDFLCLQNVVPTTSNW